jgi:O-antigen/teichoic acid export membrane protein
MFKLLNKNQIYYTKPLLSLGWMNFKTSLLLSINNLLNTARQQGVRLILAPLAGVNALVAFSTMRTGASVALQGLNTITNPLLPELMLFMNQKKQEKTEAAFAMVWTVLVVIMAPAIVVFQLIMPGLFKIWTKGKVEFDPLVFALLSITILIYALAQPAMAIIRGNNVLNVQVRVSIITAGVVVLGMFILIPQIGILGAAISLVIAEIVDTHFYKVAAKKWLLNNGLHWPIKTSRMAALSVFVSTLSLGCLIYLPNYKVIVLTVAFILFFSISVEYYKSLPKLVKDKISSIFSKKNKIDNGST